MALFRICQQHPKSSRYREQSVRYASEYTSIRNSNPRPHNPESERSNYIKQNKAWIKWHCWIAQKKQVEDVLDLSRLSVVEKGRQSKHSRTPSGILSSSNEDGFTLDDLANFIEADIPLCDDRLQRSISHLLQQLGSVVETSTLSEILRTGSVLAHLGYASQSRHLVRIAAQGLSFASTKDLVLFCETLNTLFKKTEENTSTHAKPDSQQKSESSNPNSILHDDLIGLQWKQGPNGLAAVMDGIAQRLLKELCNDADLNVCFLFHYTEVSNQCKSVR